MVHVDSVSILRRVSLAAVIAALISVGWGAPHEVANPYPRAVVVGEALKRWDFDAPEPLWTARNQCAVNVADGVLNIESSGADPYLDTACEAKEPSVVVRLRMRSATGGKGSLYWATAQQRGFSEARHAGFQIIHDNQWHEYEVVLTLAEEMTALRLDPGSAPGFVKVDWLAVHRGGPHPLEITRLIPTAEGSRLVVHNHDQRTWNAAVDGRPMTLAAGRDTEVPLQWPPAGALNARLVTLEAPGLPAIQRRFWRFGADAAGETIERTVGSTRVEFAKDGSIARLHRRGRLVAVLAPLVHREGQIPRLEPANPNAWPLILQGDGVRVEVGATVDEQLRITIHSDAEVEGPVARLLGELEQGLMAGVEYLGKSEHSSSRLDIETDEHLRFEPNPMNLTMPLMACVTDRAGLAMLWEDTSLQPTFAAPDFVDFAPGHRMSLKGRRIDVRLRLDDGWPDGGRLEPAILWAVRTRGLPPVPAPPRDRVRQNELSLAAYRGSILDQEHGGWFHAVVPGVRRMPDRGAPFADCASAIYRLAGELPKTGALQPGGAHVNNACSYFLGGQAAEWLDHVNKQAEHLRSSQQPDGSYRYDGKYRRGHFENTASGVCANPARLLVEHARLTGNQQSLAAGLRALEFIERFRTPRGAQTWEVPLHTPDILASAHLVWAFVRAYELTGEQRYLNHARRWAITGLPFVYQWSDRPIMTYAAIAVLGATDWKAPNWIGLPVQWCGTVYAYSLLLLAPHDQTLDWRQVAEGILVCSEQMQYPDGPSQGCLPDAFILASQTRLPADINPGALVSLRLKLAGELDDLSVAAGGKHRVVAPFPARIEAGQAVVTAPAGVRYQVVIDGSRIVNVQSQGRDSIPLAPSSPPQ